MNMQEAVKYYCDLLHALKVDPGKGVQAGRIAVNIDYTNAGTPGTVRMYVPAKSLDCNNDRCVTLERKWTRYSQDQKVDKDGVTGICIEGL